MLKHALVRISEHRLSFTLSVILLMIFGAVLLMTNKASAAGENSSNRVVLVTNAVEFEIVRPLQVTIEWVGAQNDPGTSKVYPGQELAIGAVNIENQSPIRYGALLRAEPLIVQGDRSWPQLTLLYLLNGVEYRQYTPIVMEPGATVNIQVRIFVDWGAPPATFRGLNLVVDTGPPPSETISECPAGCQLG
ncbi:MAG: hypothetical protein Q7R48_02390 [bacterium]|nr:hypothetical protein [bacterium]